MLRRTVLKLLLSLVFAGGLAQAAWADDVQGQPIYAQNNTSRTIWVAARYIPAGETGYIVNGFWKVNPGEKVLIFYNNARYVYFYARDLNNGAWRGDHPFTVRGETVSMFRQDTTDRYDPFTMNFNP